MKGRRAWPGGHVANWHHNRKVWRSDRNAARYPGPDREVAEAVVPVACTVPWYVDGFEVTSPNRGRS